MPIQYPDAPQFQAPNFNFLGAYAQGAALQQQQLQEERLRQQMDLAERAAGITANKESRQAAQAEMESRVKLQELKSNILKHAQMQLQSVPPGDDATYQAVISQYKDMLPDEYAIASKYKWDEDTRRRMLLPAEQQYKQTTKDITLPSGETQTMRYPEFGGGAATPVEGLRSTPREEWEPIKQGDFIIGYKSKYGTQQITPEEFQRRSSIPSTKEVSEYINQRAPQMGVDPRVANRVFTQGEYGGKYVGDQGSSFGPTQLHYGGVAPGGNRVAGLGDEFTKVTGLDARDPSTWREQIDFSLGQAAKSGWGPWHAAKKVGVGQFEGINAMAPRQIASAGPLNGMLAPPVQLPSAAPQQPAIPTPLRSYTPAPLGTQEEQGQKSALNFLNAVEYNPETGNSRPAELLQTVGGGRPTQVLYGLARAFGVSTSGTRGEARLSSSQKNALLDKVGGSLGGKGFTDEDRRFVMDAIGGLDDTAVPVGDRLSKFDEAVRMLTRRAGVPYKPAPQLERLQSIGGRGEAGEAPKASAAPKAGVVEEGYRFKGGDPSNPANWEKQ